MSKSIPSCKVVLSNEDSQGGKCDICHNEVVQKEKTVWYLRITEYADKLLDGLNEVNYLPNIRLQQENWIGKSTGAFIDFKIKDTDEKLRVLGDRLIYLRNLGLDGLETYHIESNQNDRNYIHSLALKYDLYETGGSDFHSFKYANGVGDSNIRFPQDYEPLLVKKLIKEKKVLGDIGE